MPKFNQNKLGKLRLVDKVLKALYIFPKNKKSYDALIKQDVKEIIIIGFLLIGDTIMYLSAFNVIRRNYPNAKITIVCEKPTEIILKTQGLIDDFVIINCPWIVTLNYTLKNLINFAASIIKINRKQYNLAIDFRGDWRNIFYMNFIRSARKVSFDFTGGEYMLTDPIRGRDDITNFTEEAIYLLEKIGCEVFDDDIYPKLKLGNEDRVFVEKFKNENNLVQEFIIGVHPGASQEVKRWDERKYAELIKRLSYVSTKVKFLIFEGPGERDTVKTINEILSDTDVKFTIVNKKLHEYVLLMSLCNLIICNDSGAAHISRAYSIPSVIIFGNTDPSLITSTQSKVLQVAISHTLECKPCFQSFCKYGHKQCISGIDVNEVYLSALSTAKQFTVAS